MNRKKIYVENTKNHKIPKPKNNFMLKSIKCGNCKKFSHSVVFTKYNGILCKSCYYKLFEEYDKQFSGFINSMEIEWDVINVTSLEQLTEYLSHYYRIFIVVNEQWDIPKQYQKYIDYAKEIYKTLELGNTLKLSI